MRLNRRKHPPERLPHEMEPVNPNCEAPLYIEIELVEQLPKNTRNKIINADDEDLVHMHWRNATLTMRAAAIRAILKL